MLDMERKISSLAANYKRCCAKKSVWTEKDLTQRTLCLKQGVTLTGRNTTGPPSRAAPGELRCICAVLQTTTTPDASDRY